VVVFYFGLALVVLLWYAVFLVFLVEKGHCWHDSASWRFGISSQGIFLGVVFFGGKIVG